MSIEAHLRIRFSWMIGEDLAIAHLTDSMRVPPILPNANAASLLTRRVKPFQPSKAVSQP